MLLYLFVLIAGGSVLSIEILGARMLAPFYGLGPFLWSVLLAVTLVALALGLAIGGRRADRDARTSGLTIPLLVSGCWVLLIPWIRRPILLFLEPLGLRLDVVVAAALLMGPPVVLLGTVVPLAVRLKISGMDDVGRAVGTVGGVFAAGGVASALSLWFVLVPTLGVLRVAFLTGLLLITGGALAFRSGQMRRTVAQVAAVLAVIGVPLLALKAGTGTTGRTAGLLAVQNGSYHEVRVVERNGARYLLVDGTIHTVVDPRAWVSLHRAAAAIEVAKRLYPGPGKLLVVGLRGGSVAKSFARDGWTVTALEANATAAKAAADLFGLRPSEARLVHADAREFVRRDTAAYDLVVLDAFADNFIPPDLVTREFFALVARRLAPGGILAVNIESLGWGDILVRSLAATLRTRFERVLALPTSEPPNTLGSIVLLASDRKLELPDGSLPDPFDYLNDALGHWAVVQMDHAWASQYQPEVRGIRVLTDDWNPSDLWGERINLAARLELHRFFGPRGPSW